MPNYIGYVQVGTNAPTLFFDTGFLVQVARNPAHVGWHAHQFDCVYGVNMPPDPTGPFGNTLSALTLFGARMNGVHKLVVKQLLKERFVRRHGQVGSAVPDTTYVLVDNHDTEGADGACMYGFSGPLLDVHSPLFQPTFDAAHALATLGPLNPDGTPLKHPVVSLSPGMYLLT